ncbi:MAG: hypothetical protein DRO39_09685 [Thermoprotei archaeon]|nr:MAG: hypothetical protein DRO39_09685 [Thermoprotei archaeon]
MRLLPILVMAAILIAIAAPAASVFAQGEQVLIVAQMKYIKNPNPLRSETWYDWWLNIATFDSLFEQGPDLEPKPWICDYYEVSPDGKVWLIHILDNVYWHDGVKFTVRDIAFSIDFYKKYKFPSRYPDVEMVDRYEILDDYTIKIYLKKPYVWFKNRFGMALFVPEHIWKYVPQLFKDPEKFNPMNPDHVAKVLELIKKNEPPEIASKVEAFVEKYHHLRVGNGPFILARWKEGELLEMVKNPLYFKKGFPRVDKLIYKVYAKPDAQYLAVKKGEAHIMVWTVPYAVIKEAEKNPDIVLPKAPDVYIGYIGINMKDPILKNPLVRKAIAYLIDREKIVKVLMLGYGEPIYTYIHPGYKKWVNMNVPEYDHLNIEKAKELLDKAGFKDIDGDGWRETPDGKDFTLTILTPSYDPVRVRIGDFMVEWFKKAGIKLVNRPVDFDTLIDLVYNEHKFQLYIIENDANFAPWYYSSYYVKDQYKPGGNNPWGFINDTFEKLLREAENTIDENKRAEMYYKMQEILADQLPLIPLYVRYWMQVYRAELSGVVLMTGGALNYWTLINANFKGEKPVIPITKLKKPATTTPATTPTTPKPTPGPTATVTKTVEKTVTLTTTVERIATVATTVERTVVRTETNWGVAVGIGIVLLIVGIAIGYAIKRR